MSTALSRRSGAPASLIALGVVAAAFLVLPLAGLVWRAPWGHIADTLGGATVLEALRVSLIASVGALVACLLIGVPLAWVLARVDFPGR